MRGVERVVGIGNSRINARVMAVLAIGCMIAVGMPACGGTPDTPLPPGTNAAGGAQGATGTGGGTGSNACPQGIYPDCQTNADCPCTHFCSPIVPNGIKKSCTIPCTSGADCDRPELGINCPNKEASCCQAANVCLPS